MKGWVSKYNKFMREAHVIEWADFLDDTGKVTIFTDSARSMQMLSDENNCTTKADLRILKIMGYIISNFIVVTNVIFKHASAKDNKVADLLLRWASSQADKKPRRLNKTMELSKDEREVITDLETIEA